MLSSNLHTPQLDMGFPTDMPIMKLIINTVKPSVKFTYNPIRLYATVTTQASKTARKQHTLKQNIHRISDNCIGYSKESLKNKSFFF